MRQESVDAHDSTTSQNRCLIINIKKSLIARLESLTKSSQDMSSIWEGVALIIMIGSRSEASQPIAGRRGRRYRGTKCYYTASLQDSSSTPVPCSGCIDHVRVCVCVRVSEPMRIAQGGSDASGLGALHWTVDSGWITNTIPCLYLHESIEREEALHTQLHHVHKYCITRLGP